MALTTLDIGEESLFSTRPERPTTMATGEEDGGGPTTMATGEEDGSSLLSVDVLSPFGQF